jgi:flagellar basal body-associated protein FliL
MAKEMDAEKQKDTPEEMTEERTAKKAGIRDFLPWITMSAILVFCAGAGFGVGRLFGGLGKSDAEPNSQEQVPAHKEPVPDTSEGGADGLWYYPLQPVVANLDEPGVKRYVRATLTLAVSSKMDQKKGEAFFKEKNPLLTNWLTIYLASLGIDDIRGDKNLKRIQSEMMDTFNDKLFPDAKPQIEGILFREFAVQ